jgi:DNA topoisomerase-3
MKEIAGMTSKIVERAKSYQSDTVPIDDPATLKTPCPKCGGVVSENYRRFACGSCDFSIGKHPGSRTLEVEEVEQLLRDRTIGPLQGFISKMGRPFAAVLKITPEYKLEFDFGQANADDGSDEPVDFSGQTPVGACPKCSARVYEQPMAYVCEKSVGPGKSCDFRSGKVILQQPIERAQMEKLLAEGRTDVLRAFISNRTRRKFSAFLAKKPDGAIGFEFEPREPRAGKTPRKSTKASEPAATIEAPVKRAAKGSAKSATAGSAEKPARKVPAKRPAKTAKRAATKTAARKTAAKKAAKAGAGARKAPTRG